MQDLVGIVRREDEMERALDGIAETEGARRPRSASPAIANTIPAGIPRSILTNLLTVSEAITRAAIERKESRGAHFRDDFPEKERRSAHSIFVISKGTDGAMQVERETLTADDRRAEADDRGDEVRETMSTATFQIWRGDSSGGEFRDYTTEISEGMVVLDAVHHIQAEQANDLAVRWNCKAGKCGSCSAEINGMPKLMCMTRLNTLPLDQPITIAADEDFSADQRSGDRRVVELTASRRASRSSSREARRTRRHLAHAAGRRRPPAGVPQVHRMLPVPGRLPRAARPSSASTNSSGRDSSIYTAQLEMNPIDTENRLPDLRKQHGIGYCNITKCCTKVCPENITITDNAIIPLKERVVDQFFDPLGKLFRVFGADK